MHANSERIHLVGTEGVVLIPVMLGILVNYLNIKLLEITYNLKNRNDIADI